MMQAFPIRGFNLCESILRHTPEELRRFFRRMKMLGMNTVIIHYDYGWKHYQDLILEECRNADIKITLMTFGPRTFFSLSHWKQEYFARDEKGQAWTTRPECETHPCCSHPEALACFADGAEKWLSSLPPEITRVHMRAGDGMLFCRCPRCRQRAVRDLWQPYVKAFAQAVLKCRPELEMETDIYYERYELPEDCSAHELYTSLMFDPFPRSPLYPLDAQTPVVHQELLGKLKNWCVRFPGKIYIHENAMKQGFFGIYQHGDNAALRDLEIFRELGVQGVCYEAYEPGYASFAGMFEKLAAALAGKNVPASFDPVTDWCCKNGSTQWAAAPGQPLEEFIPRGDALEHARLIQAVYSGKINGDLYRRYVDFALSRPEKIDWLYGCFTIARRGLVTGTLSFNKLSQPAAAFTSRRKLWDFLEDLPEKGEISELCREIILELAQKAI